MALIKQAHLGDAIRSAIVLDLGDLMRQGEMLKGAARAEADRIVAQGREERQRLIEGAQAEGRRAGYVQGFDEGRAAGVAEGRESTIAERRETLASLEQAWSAALADFELRREELLTAARTDLLRLAVRAAELVTRRAIELRGGAAEAQLATVLDLLAAPTKLVLRVCPGDEQAFREALPELASRLESASHVQIVPDPLLGPGSCIAATPGGGEIDASVETQLRRIVAAVLPDVTGPGTVPPGEQAGVRPRKAGP